MTTDKQPTTKSNETSDRLTIESDIRAGVCKLPNGDVVRSTKEQCEKNGWKWEESKPTK